jgi:hypothetical protein
MEVERFKHRQLAPTVGPIVMITGELVGPIIKINLLQQAVGFPSEWICFLLRALEYSSSWIPETEQSMSNLILLQHHRFHCGVASTISRFVHVQIP